MSSRIKLIVFATAAALAGAAPALAKIHLDGGGPTWRNGPDIYQGHRRIYLTPRGSAPGLYPRTGYHTGYIAYVDGQEVCITPANGKVHTRFNHRLRSGCVTLLF